MALLICIVICGIATCFSKNLMVSLIIFMAYSVMMSIIWALLKAPDLSITEAAVGAGISSILMFITLKKIRDMNQKKAEDAKAEKADESSEDAKAEKTDESSEDAKAEKTDESSKVAKAEKATESSKENEKEIASGTETDAWKMIEVSGR